MINDSLRSAQNYVQPLSITLRSALCSAKRTFRATKSNSSSFHLPDVCIYIPSTLRAVITDQCGLSTCCSNPSWFRILLPSPFASFPGSPRHLSSFRPPFYVFCITPNSDCASCNSLSSSIYLHCTPVDSLLLFPEIAAF